MHLERARFRSWWQPPRARGEDSDERRISWLELFYDLVYVAIVAQLSHSLAEHPDGKGVATFAFLFVVVWWAWFNGAMYHDQHGNDDIRTRVFTFLQMIAVAGMAVFAGDALGSGAVGFALSYTGYHLILTWLWWRTGTYLPAHRPITGPYAITFLLTSVFFAASVFVTAPTRFVLWGVALGTDLVTLLSAMKRVVAARGARQDPTPLVTATASERFAQFTIIVLGEVVVGVVNGVSVHQPIGWGVAGIGLMSMGIAIGLWWLYFDIVAGLVPVNRLSHCMWWVYLHVPVGMGMAAAGASVFNLVEHAGEGPEGSVRWILVGSIALVLVCIAGIMHVLQVSEQYARDYRMGSVVLVATGVVAVAVAKVPFGDVVELLATVLGVLALPMVAGVVLWHGRNRASERGAGRGLVRSGRA